MSDAAEPFNESQGTLTRRNALRAGVAVGVGAVAWSGASITSFGGTPAYAVACSQAIPPVNVSGGCRNTTQSNAGGCTALLSFQPATFTPPPNYTISPNPIENNLCCDDNVAGSFTFPDNVTCTLTFLFSSSTTCGTANETAYGSSTFGPDSESPLEFTFSCPQIQLPGANWSNARYRIEAHCFTGTEEPPEECFS